MFNRIKTASVKRMTTEQTAQCHTDSPPRAMQMNSINGILRAGGIKTTTGRKQGREKQLVEPYRTDAESSHA